ncbi:hypothetical protein WHK35_14275, partial [Staphylococcus aureus]|uniref:hypothetical protein n=1 Tax=Staphylococcus aureus TaxID=1280 RepID=UPI0039BE08EB
MVDSLGTDSLNRISIASKLLACIMLCEFVYVNSNAVPDFKTIQWTTNFALVDSVPAPAMAIFRSEELNLAADLIWNDNTTEKCKADARSSSGQHDCFGHLDTFSLGEARTLEYMTYDPRPYNFSLRPRHALALLFQYA